MPPAGQGTFGPYPKDTEIADFLESTVGDLYADNSAKLALIPDVELAFKNAGVFMVEDLLENSITQDELSRFFLKYLDEADARVMLRVVLKHAGERDFPLLPQAKGASHRNFQSPEAGSSRSTASHGG